MLNKYLLDRCIFPEKFYYMEKARYYYNIKKYNHLLNLIFVEGTIKLLSNCLLCARHHVNLNNNLEIVFN